MRRDSGRGEIAEMAEGEAAVGAGQVDEGLELGEVDGIEEIVVVEEDDDVSREEGAVGFEHIGGDREHICAGVPAEAIAGFASPFDVPAENMIASGGE